MDQINQNLHHTNNFFLDQLNKADQTTGSVQHNVQSIHSDVASQSRDNEAWRNAWDQKITEAFTGYQDTINTSKEALESNRNELIKQVENFKAKV